MIGGQDGPSLTLRPATVQVAAVTLSAVHRVPHFTPIAGTENLLAMLLFAVIVVALCARPVLRPHPDEVADRSSPASSV